jgi:hypothetical protein
MSHADSVQAGYVGVLGRHLDSLGTTQNSPAQILPPGTNVYNYIPFPDFSPNQNLQTTQGVSSYNSLQTVYQHRFSAGLSMLANYTYSRCMTDQITLSGSAPSYRANTLPGFGIAGDHTLCYTDATHVVHLSGTYELPVGKGQRWLNHGNALLQQTLGGWAVNYIYTYQSGQPFTIGCPVATTADYGCFADVVSGANIYAGPHNQSQWLNPAAFVNPPIATSVGQTDYSVLGGPPQQARGPAFSDLDFSVFKYFPITEATRLQFRAEAFNLTNSPQFNNPGQLNFLNKVNFSAITGLRNNPRLLQFALKLYF